MSKEKKQRQSGANTTITLKEDGRIINADVKIKFHVDQTKTELYKIEMDDIMFTNYGFL